MALLDWLRTSAPNTTTADRQPSIPRRSAASLTPDRAATTIPDVYRAISILTTSCSQLSIDAQRNGATLDNPHPVIRRPHPDMSRSDWIEQVVLSMVTDGNAFLRKRYADGKLLALEILNPHEVNVARTRAGDLRYSHKGTNYTRADIEHLHLMRLPGALRGVGPIEAARTNLTATTQMGDYLGGWWTDNGQPAGILASDLELTDAEAKKALAWWNGVDEQGNRIENTANPTRTRVLGKGLDYRPILLKPADALWIDQQRLTTLQIARIFGVPSTLMLTAVEGGSKTYSNVEQEWIAFVRFTLMGYLRKIEEALSSVVPHGQSVRFNLETLLRTDTLSRYQAHTEAITAGIYDAAHAARIEGLDPTQVGTTSTPPAIHASAQEQPA